MVILAKLYYLISDIMFSIWLYRNCYHELPDGLDIICTIGKWRGGWS